MRSRSTRRTRRRPKAGAATPAADGHILADTSPEALRTRFHLSKSEAAVAALLAEACSVTEAAARLNISIFTVRAHVRRIYDKTDVSRQAALVRRLLIVER